MSRPRTRAEIDELLVLAARDGALEEIAELLKEGANLESRAGDFNETPLLAAARHGRLEAFELLLEVGASPTAVDDFGHTLLHSLAADERFLPHLEAMLDRGALFDKRSKSGRTPLMMALHRRCARTARLLLERGADLHAQDDRGRTSLMVLADVVWPAERSEVDDELVPLFRDLLQAGARVDVKDRFGENPLHLAVRQGAAEFVSLLVEHGADVDEPTSRGTTPLQIAATLEPPSDLGEQLLDLGATLDFYSAVCLRRHDEVSAMLIEEPELAGYVHPIRKDSVLSRAVHHGDPQMVKLLLSHGADTEAPVMHDTVLHCAIQHKKSLALVKLLVDHGADVNRVGGNGLPALAAAAAEGRVDIARYLLAQGADPNLSQSERGLTVLGTARDPAMAELLHTFGAR